jgi:hypothetical protein
MTGGLAFVLDDEKWLDDNESAKILPVTFDNLVNRETLSVRRLSEKNM